MVYYISHRANYNCAIKENSLNGIKYCISKGLKMIEIDIRLSKDNRIVVFHDNNLQRLYTNSEQINTLNADYLWEYYNIPTLDKVFRLVKNKCKLYLDVKGASMEIFKYLDILIKKHIKHRTINLKNIYVAAFDINKVFFLKNNFLFKVKKGIILEYDLDINKEKLKNKIKSIFNKNHYQNIETRIRFILDYIPKLDFISIDLLFLKFLVSKKFIFNNLEVFIWTINSEKEIHEIKNIQLKYKISIRGIITDKPFFMKKYFSFLKKKYYYIT